MTTALEKKRVELFTLMFGKENGKYAADQFLKSTGRIFYGSFIAAILSVVSVFHSVQVMLFPFASIVKKIPRFDYDIMQLTAYFGDHRESMFVTIYCFILLYILLFLTYVFYEVINSFINRKIFMDIFCFKHESVKLFFLQSIIFAAAMYFFYCFRSNDHTEVENLSRISSLYRSGLILPFEFMAIGMILAIFYSYLVFVCTFIGGIIAHYAR